jgi:hypothetical protein
MLVLWYQKYSGGTTRGGVGEKVMIYQYVWKKHKKPQLADFLVCYKI